MEMVDVFQDALLARHDNIVDCAQMLCVLGQTDTAGVRDDGDAEFRGHEQHGDDFVDAAEPTRVDLADVDGSGLQELLEHDAVLAHFAGRDADAVGLEGFADGFVAEDWMCVSRRVQFVRGSV